MLYLASLAEITAEMIVDTVMPRVVPAAPEVAATEQVKEEAEEPKMEPAEAQAKKCNLEDEKSMRQAILPAVRWYINQQKARGIEMIKTLT